MQLLSYTHLFKIIFNLITKILYLKLISIEKLMMQKNCFGLDNMPRFIIFIKVVFKPAFGHVLSIYSTISNFKTKILKKRIEIQKFMLY